MHSNEATKPQLIDQFGREVSYLRLSVTDRCDFRCVYCMSEDMQFLPKHEILSLEETERLASLFIELGVRKIRLTGGEPLVRHGVMKLIEAIGSKPGLETLALTSNASQLQKYAPELYKAGVNKLNISLDSLQPERFKKLTRTGDVHRVLAGISAAKAAGFKDIRLNSVVLKGINDDEISALVRYASDQAINIAFIEEMPLGDVGRSRQSNFLSGAYLRETLAEQGLILLDEEQQGALAGPARYWRLADSGIKVGFIEPHSNNFCASCNRVRLTVQGRLLLCLGNEHSLDLKALLRDGASDDELKQAIIAAMSIKPEKHEFDLAQPITIKRFMNQTGG